MRVLVNCLSSISGGAKAYLRNLCRPLFLEFLNHNKHDLFFLVCEEQLGFFCDVPNDHLILLNGKRPLGFFRIIWEKISLPRIVVEHNIDVLFTPYQVGPKIKGVKNVLMIRNMEPFLFSRYKYSFNTWLRNKVLALASNYSLCKADRTIAVSQFAARYLEDLGISDSRIFTIYHGSPTFSEKSISDLSRLATLGLDRPFVLSCGSILPYRRYEDVIHAFNRALPSISREIVLVIVGTGSDVGYRKMLDNIISRSPCIDRILMLGGVAWSDMEILYRNSMSCIIASEIEACPNIAIEAMASGSCILAAQVQPLPEILDDCAIMFISRNISSLSSKLVDSIVDSGMRQDFQFRSKQRSNSFSWATTAAMTYNALTNWGNQ